MDVDTEQSFNKFLENVILQHFPDFNFYPEPDFQQLLFPCITVRYSTSAKTNTLAMLKSEVQIDILVAGWKRVKCNRTAKQLLEILNLTADVPGRARRIEKYKFYDEAGNKLEIPEVYPNLQSDIRWTMAGDLQRINEPDMPELMHNTFSLFLHHKDN